MKTKKLFLFLLLAIFLMPYTVGAKTEKTTTSSDKTKNQISPIIISLTGNFALFYYEQEVTLEDVGNNMREYGFILRPGALDALLNEVDENELKNLDNLGTPIVSLSNFSERKLIVFNESGICFLMDTYYPLTGKRNITKVSTQKKQLNKVWFIGSKKDVK